MASRLHPLDHVRGTRFFVVCFVLRQASHQGSSCLWLGVRIPLRSGLCNDQRGRGRRIALSLFYGQVGFRMARSLGVAFKASGNRNLENALFGSGIVSAIAVNRGGAKKILR